jgi:hypothetical protein
VIWNTFWGDAYSSFNTKLIKAPFNNNNISTIGHETFH